MKELLEKITAGLDEIEIRRESLQQYEDDFNDFLNQQVKISMLGFYTDGSSHEIHLARMEDLRKITNNISVSTRGFECLPYIAYGYRKGIKFFTLLSRKEYTEGI